MLPILRGFYIALAALLWLSSPSLAATTWDPAQKHASITLSNGNLTATSSASGAWRSVRSTTWHVSGNYYAEFLITAYDGAGGDNGQVVGLGDRDATLVDRAGADSSGVGGQCSIGFWWHQGTPSGNLTGCTGATATGVVVSLAVNLDRRLIWWRDSINNIWNAAGGDPSSNTGGRDYSYINVAALFLQWSADTAGGVADAVTLRTSAASFTQTVPSGYQPWDAPEPINTSCTRVSAGPPVKIACTGTGAGFFPVPTDFSFVNTIEIISGGAGGCGFNRAGAGGGAGAYAKLTNLSTCGRNNLIPFIIGAGSAGGVNFRGVSIDGGGTSFNNGLPGDFTPNTLEAHGGHTCGAAEGVGGGNADPFGGPPGIVTYTGGSAGFGGEFGNGGAGGGGAAGPLGIGRFSGIGGPSNTAGGASGGGGNGGGGDAQAGQSNNLGGAGGVAGDATAGGAGGNATTSTSAGPGSSGSGGGGGARATVTGHLDGGAGGNGNEFAPGYGSGGGGGGGGSGEITGEASNGGNGGLYGGGGGMAGLGTFGANPDTMSIGNGGDGAPGLIFITYTPSTPGACPSARPHFWITQ